MDITELKKDLIDRCKLSRKPIEDKIQAHEERLNCNDKKIKEMARKDDLGKVEDNLDGKADIGEVENLKDWVSKIDSRMWAVLVGVVLTVLSTGGTFVMLLLKDG